MAERYGVTYPQGFDPIADAVAARSTSLIGKRIPKMDAPDKASGKTRYIHDINLPGQLHAKILRSAHRHAKIVSIDTRAAKQLPGVHAVITAADVPWQQPIGVAKDHLPLKTDRVRSLRDEIAVDRNLNAGYLEGGLLLGLASVIAFAT